LEGLVIAGAVVLGLLFGSFANVAIHRWPRGGTIGRPSRSVCPSCATPIRAADNVPVVSWFLLRSRCRSCGAPISGRYAIVEALTGLLFGVALGVYGLDPLVPAVLAFVWSAVVAAVIDLEHRIIPNRLTLRLPFVLVVLLLLPTLVEGEWWPLGRAVTTGLAIPAVMLGLSELFRLLRGKQGIGMGDVKFAASIGLVVGYLGGWHVVVFAYATILSAMVIVVALMLARRANLATRIPFGPYLAIGALVAVLAGDPAVAFVQRILGF
jgi:leader peptidase (prepilin peptidase) / N-methyltransferase